MSGSSDFVKYAQLGAYHWSGHFSASLGSYDLEIEAHYLAALKLALGALGSLRERTVLDAGCGDGVLLDLLGRQGALAVGLDAEQVGLELARQELKRRGTTASLIQGICEALPFCLGAFDAILAVEVIEHLEDPDRFMSEAGRVLTDEGILIVTTPRRREGEPPKSQFHVREFSRDELTDMLTRHFPQSEVFGFCHSWVVAASYGLPGLRAASRAVFKRFARFVSNPCAWLVASAAADRCDSLAGIAWRRGSRRVSTQRVSDAIALGR